MLPTHTRIQAAVRETERHLRPQILSAFRVLDVRAGKPLLCAGPQHERADRRSRYRRYRRRWYENVSVFD